MVTLPKSYRHRHNAAASPAGPAAKLTAAGFVFAPEAPAETTSSGFDSSPRVVALPDLQDSFSTRSLVTRRGDTPFYRGQERPREAVVEFVISGRKSRVESPAAVRGEAAVVGEAVQRDVARILARAFVQQFIRDEASMMDSSLHYSAPSAPVATTTLEQLVDAGRSPGGLRAPRAKQPGRVCSTRRGRDSVRDRSPDARPVRSRQSPARGGSP